MDERQKKEYQTVVLGALLHDIGKVVQRAQDNPTKMKHTQWGYDWLKENGFENKIALSAIAHHYEKDDDYALNNNNGLIWYESDNLASKERKVKEKLEEGKWHSEINLASPFSRINNPYNIDERPPLAFLSLVSSGIPEALEAESEVTKDNYKDILNYFENDFNRSGIPNPYSIDFLLMLFEKHFSRVPAITMRIYSGLKKEEIKDKHPDISLYDHSKLTAAIAGCMYHYIKETYAEKWNKNELLRDEILNVPDQDKPYLLIGGDVSGVQKFIYTITSEGALKSLKGRSFYIELLVEHIVSEVLEGLNLTRCNLIFSGGGHFYILSHNTYSSKETINNIKERINSYLFEEFRGNLQIHIESIAFHPDYFKDVSDIWRELSEKLEISKKHKWLNRLDDILKPEMPHPDCLTESCAVCFREDLELKEHEEFDRKICDPCYSQYKLGSGLVSIAKQDYPVLYKFADKPEGDSIKIEGYYYQLKRGWNPQIHPGPIAVYRINDYTAKHYSHPKSICLPIGIFQHDNLNELLDAASVYGINRIAVLRMDIDNLGKIFSQAVPNEHRTFSRMASISRWLNIFFKYYLNDIVEGKDIEERLDITKRNIKSKGRMLSIVYSGGDDLFIIGHWLDVTEAAYDISQYLRKYTGNPFITISGGIAINHEKYPVYQYAKNAGAAEDIAKVNKDSITLFGNKDFTWLEVEKVIERVNLFCSFLSYKDDHLEIDEEKLPKTFFYRLLSLSRRFNEEGVLVLPKAAYLISRAKLKSNEDDNLRIKEIIMNSNKEEWKITEVATIWILMLMRKGGE